tara:strand:+ start:26 stop:619 length:594 start_codon:yes stop_codon:yes gene_type:complete
MNKILRTNNYHTVEDIGDAIVKTFKRPKRHLSYDWYDWYKSFYEETKVCCKILEFKPYRIVMEKVEGVMLDEWWNHYACNKQNVYNVYKVLKVKNDIENVFYNWNSKKQDMYVHHSDLAFYNIITDNELSKHIVLEPEGFHFTPFEYHDFYMHTFSHLRDFSTIGHFARNIQMNYNPGEFREDRKYKYLHNHEMIKK